MEQDDNENPIFRRYDFREGGLRMKVTLAFNETTQYALKLCPVPLTRCGESNRRINALIARGAVVTDTIDSNGNRIAAQENFYRKMGERVVWRRHFLMGTPIAPATGMPHSYVQSMDTGMIKSAMDCDDRKWPDDEIRELNERLKLAKKINPESLGGKPLPGAAVPQP